MIKDPIRVLSKHHSGGVPHGTEGLPSNALCVIGMAEGSRPRLGDRGIKRD